MADLAEDKKYLDYKPVILRYADMIHSEDKPKPEIKHAPAAPEGALTKDQCLEIKKNHREMIIYFVGDAILGLGVDTDRWGIIKGEACEFVFSRSPPEYYFTNWFLAWGYSLRYTKAKDHE